nr:MAG TPA: hypothetical protein [Caudoviricetes sp.]
MLAFTVYALLVVYLIIFIWGVIGFIVMLWEVFK